MSTKPEILYARDAISHPLLRIGVHPDPKALIVYLELLRRSHNADAPCCSPLCIANHAGLLPSDIGDILAAFEAARLIHRFLGDNESSFQWGDHELAPPERM